MLWETSGTADMLWETSGTARYTKSWLFESLPPRSAKVDLSSDSKICKALLLKFCGDLPLVCCVEFGSSCVTLPISRQVTIDISDVTHAISVIAVKVRPTVRLVWGNFLSAILASERQIWSFCFLRFEFWVMFSARINVAFACFFYSDATCEVYLPLVDSCFFLDWKCFRYRILWRNSVSVLFQSEQCGTQYGIFYTSVTFKCNIFLKTSDVSSCI